MYFTAFPDLHVTIDDQVSECDKIVTRWTARGTHQGELTGGIPPMLNFVGLQRNSPTGKEVTITGVSVDRISNGKITEHFGVHDSLGMMQQIGALPTIN
jgi:predicted ester cyclase